MSATYPGGVYSPRTKENKSGVEYDESKTTVGYAEDVISLDDEVIAIENELGLGPKWASSDVKERLKGIRSLSDAVEDTITIKGSNVGIGTDSPARKLDISSGVIRLSDNYQIEWGGANNMIHGSEAGDYLIFATGNGAEKVRINSSGNVGIGTAVPSRKLTLRSANFQLGIIDSDSEKEWDITSYSNTGLSIYENAIDPRLTILAGGNVGIGTTSPSALLDINSNIIRLRTSKTPASASDTGNAGDICWDSDYIYVCIATDTWKRAALSSW